MATAGGTIGMALCAARATACLLLAIGMAWPPERALAATKLSVLYDPPLQYGPMLGGTNMIGNTLVGTVAYDGCCGAIFVYDLSLRQFGIAHVFAGTADGWGPNALTVSANGTIFGTTGADGINGDGTIFMIAAGGTFQKLYDFANGADGAFPRGRMVADAKGRLYGVTSSLGPGNGGTIFRGTLFNLTPPPAP